jgi:hypothetical protein
MLAIASSLDHKKASCNLLSIISKVAASSPATTKTFWEIYGCVASSIIWTDTLLKRKPPEFYWHKVFKNNLEYLIPGAAILKKKKKDGCGAPDFWIRISNDICPVELKRECFTIAACRQLERYIKEYGAPYGFAVAQKLSAPLYKNMKFISLEGLGL